ncbi:class I SAM-dependent methyltransferase [Virgibacillus senegalensis]|uniref:class I SAM-dependent methyltransferase n=1 Tax=Virgibacillus senegalensis TaxID=1499679 RepID=UPI00069FC8CC|nr:class I SAM-dependent methyltransferase [Virgibacillus senegalensis]
MMQTEVQYPWKEFFGEAYLQFSPHILHDERTKEEIKGIKQLLALDNPSTILDLGCGHGRISIPLAQEGHEVIGLDGSEVSLAQAKRLSHELGIENIEWVLSEMKNMELPLDSLDYVLNMSTAIGYVSEDEDRQAFERVYKRLKPGGKLLIDTENRDYKIKNYIPRLWDQMANQPVWSSRYFDCITGRWVEETMWYQDSVMEKATLDIRLYTATELTSMLKSCGFAISSVFGDLKGASLTIDSPRMIILAEKGGY